MIFPDFSSLFKIPWLFPDWKMPSHFSRFSSPSGNPEIPPPPSGYTLPRGKDMGPEVPYFTVDRLTGRHLWKHYFSLAVGKNTDNLKSVNLKRATEIKPGVWFKTGNSPASERSQNTVLLASTQAVYKAPHSTVWDTQTQRLSVTHTHREVSWPAVAVAVGSLRV